MNKNAKKNITKSNIYTPQLIHLGEKAYWLLFTFIYKKENI